MSNAPESKRCPKCGSTLPEESLQGLCPKCLFLAASTPTEAGQSTENRPTPPPLEDVAAAFPQLEILEFIGQGGMGFVFKARQPKLDRLVALKILPQSLAADPTFAERFNREARLLARLNHPGIVTVHDFGVAAGILPAVEPGFQPGGKSVESSAGLESSEAIASSGAHPGGKMPPSTSGKMPDATSPTPHSALPVPHFYYLLMEFVDGVNLRQAMQAGRFTPEQALAIVPKICEALQFAHNEGILHRDIKPENILLDAKGRVKIADFGIAKLVGADAAERSAELRFGASHSLDPNAPNRSSALHALTEAGKALGTPNYMAPEQRDCPGEVDHRADIYSLGVVFYEMLTGELPLGRFAPPSQKSAADPRVDEVVLRALEKEKAKRYASADEVRTQVVTIAATPDSGRRRGDASQTEQQSADKDKSQSLLTSSPTSGDPRFSRTAIVGVCWMPFFFIAFLLVSMQSVSTGEYHGPAWWQYLLMFTLLPLGITAPFGTTILGWVAVSQIRRSAGKLHGLWLAVLDGLLFPLLALDGVFAWVVTGLVRVFAEMSSNFSNLNNPQVHPPFITRLANLLSQHPELTIFAVAGIIIVLDFLIIRRVWRAVNKPLAESDAGIPPTEPARKNSTGKTIAIGCGVVAAVGLLILLLMVAFMYLSHAPVPSSARLKEQQNAPAEATFGPVMERVVTGAIDLDNGTLAELPLSQPLGETDPARYAWFNDDKSAFPWMRQRGVDVIDLGNHGLSGVDILLAPLESNDWRTLTPDGLQNKLRSLELPTVPSSSNFGNTRGTYGFQTREGSTGLLQITDTDLPRGVKIRYKLARSKIPIPRHISNGRYSAMLHYDNVDLHYLFFYDGDCIAKPTAADTTVPDRQPSGDFTFNGHSLKWLEDFSLKLDNGRTFGYQRESAYANLFLKVNGQQFDFRQGRVFVPHDNGTVEQLALFPSLAEARDLEALAKLIASQRNQSTPDFTFAPLIERVVQQAILQLGRAEMTNCWINFETGDLLGITDGQERFDAADQRLRREGADATCKAGKHGPILGTVDGLPGFVYLAERDVFQLSANELKSRWDGKSASPETQDLGERQFPQNYLFQTHNGRLGALQITGFTENPRGVKIRYKLVQNKVSPPNAPEAKMPANRSDQIVVEDLALRMIVAIREEGQ